MARKDMGARNDTSCHMCEEAVVLEGLAAPKAAPNVVQIAFLCRFCTTTSDYGADGGFWCSYGFWCNAVEMIPTSHNLVRNSGF
jgi:hypothetical protein